ncbi:MAG: hypothetical protein IJQ56_01210 [Synergistaceae bacterium]|nr:hypothetical protein [Synergistaceae bacterium]
MIKIVSTEGELYTWKPEDYTDYKYDACFFIVIRDGAYVGFYNLAYVKIILIESKNEA